MFKFNPTLKNINDNLFSKELGFDEMRNVYRMRLLYYHVYGQQGITNSDLLYGLSKYIFLRNKNINYTCNNNEPLIKYIHNKTLIIYSIEEYYTIRQQISSNSKLYDTYIDNSTSHFIVPSFDKNVKYDRVIIYSTYANRIEFKTNHFGLLNLYYLHINYVYIHQILKILKNGGSILMWYIPIHISACADLMTFLFSHFKCVKITSFEGRDYIYLQKFKGYDKNKWHKLMKYWYKFDPEYGINYTNNKQNNIILQNMNIICAKPLTTKYHIFFDTVFEDEINWGDVIKFNKIITKNQKKKWAYYFKCQHNSNYLCKRYYDTYNKFLKLCRKKNIDINPVFLKYNINELFDKRVLKQYIFISTKYILFYDILNNIYNTDNDILYMYNSLSANMDKYNICFYNLKKHDIKYIIPVFKIFGDIEINIYNDNPIKRFQLVFKKYSKFNKVDKKYDIIVCRYDDYKYIKKYAKTIIFLENINKYKPLIRYDTYKKLSYTVVGYLSSTKTKYQIYECFKDNSSYKKLVVLLKKILRFTYIDKLKPFIESKSNDYIIYEFLYKHYKPIGRKSSGYMYSQYISSLVKDRKIETFMDFGAGSGIKTKAVKNILNLKDKNVYALDKKTFESVDNTKYEYNFNYVYYDGISYPDIDIKFDLITCIQVLHHIFEIEHTIKYLKSLLKKDGLLIIKEHKIDDNKNTSMLIDIEHSLYELGQNKNTKFLNTYYARYFSELEFLRLMTINGFIYVPIPEQVFDDNNPTNYIYYMFTV